MFICAVIKSTDMKDTVFTGITKEELSSFIAAKVLEGIKSLELQKEGSGSSPDLLTSKEVAEICKVKSMSTLWYWRKQGLLVPTSRAGRKPLYKHQDVIKFLEGRNGGSDV